MPGGNRATVHARDGSRTVESGAEIDRGHRFRSATGRPLLLSVDEPASGRESPPVQELWLFAYCDGERFATSKNPDALIRGNRMCSIGRDLWHENQSSRPLLETPLCDGRSIGKEFSVKVQVLIGSLKFKLEIDSCLTALLSNG